MEDWHESDGAAEQNDDSECHVLAPLQAVSGVERQIALCDLHAQRDKEEGEHEACVGRESEDWLDAPPVRFPPLHNPAAPFSDANEDHDTAEDVERTDHRC